MGSQQAPPPSSRRFVAGSVEGPSTVLWGVLGLLGAFGVGLASGPPVDWVGRVPISGAVFSSKELLQSTN